MSLRSQLRGRDRYSKKSVEEFKDSFTLLFLDRNNQQTLQINNFLAEGLEPGIFIVGVSVLPDDMLVAIRCLIDVFYGQPDMPDVRLFIEPQTALNAKLHKSCMQIQINFTREAEERNAPAIIESLKKLTDAFVKLTIRYDVKPAVTEAANLELINNSGTEADKKAALDKAFVEPINFEKKPTDFIRLYYRSLVPNLNLIQDIFAPYHTKRFPSSEKLLSDAAAKKGFQNNNLYADLSLVESSKRGSQEVQAFLADMENAELKF